MGLDCLKSILRTIDCDIDIDERTVLLLPYSTRNPVAVEEVVKSHIRQVACNGRTVKLLMLASGRGLGWKCCICLFDKIVFSYTSAEHYDALSGLRLRLRKPVIHIDECRITVSWAGTRYHVDIDLFEDCSKCTCG